MNANVNTYFETGRANAHDSDSIRKAYLAKTRKEAFIGAIDSSILWYAIFALKIIGGIVCAISFFTILGKIELGTISPMAGLLSAIVVTMLECLCFIPIGQRPSKKMKRRI